MSEKEERVVQEIIAVLAKNECTVAEAKLLLVAAKEAILKQTTVQSPLEIYLDVHSLINRPLTETLARLGLTKNDKPAGFQEK